MPTQTSRASTYEATVMLRVTAQFKARLDRAAERLAQSERSFGRARKIGRATVVYEAMRRGLPELERELELESSEDQAER